MKKTVLLLGINLLFGTATLFAQELAMSAETNQLAEAPGLEWNSQKIDLGQVSTGAQGFAEFSFKNTTDEAVLITSIRPSCGCTVADYSREPVLPGESTTINVKYNARKAGRFYKTVRVETTAEDASVVLAISGEVI